MHGSPHDPGGEVTRLPVERVGHGPSSDTVMASVVVNAAEGEPWTVLTLQAGGLAIADTLETLCSGEPHADEVVIELQDRTSTVADGARCALARQQEALVTGLLRRFPGEIHRHQRGRRVDIPHVGDHPEGKQPDWTYDETWSGSTPADRGLAHLP